MIRKILSTTALISFTASSLHLPLMAANTHFEAVDAYLEQGGILYGFVNIEGDLEKISEATQNLMVQLRSVSPQFSQIPSLDLPGLSDQLGLLDLDAVGLSSSTSDTGFHNRTFLLTNGSTKGLLGILDVPNEAFSALNYASEDADIVLEHSINTQAIISTARDTMTALYGPDSAALFEGYLSEVIPNTSITVRQLLEAGNGRSWLIADISETETLNNPLFGEIPHIDFLIRLESAADLLQQIAEIPALQQMAPNMSVEQQNAVTTLSGFLPQSSQYSPVLVAHHESNQLFIASSSAFYSECQSQEFSKLSQSPLYLQATQNLPTEGISLLYCSPDLKPLIERYVEFTAQTAGPQGAMMRPYLNWSFQHMMSETPMASISRNEANGLYVASNWNISHKRNLATLAYANPVTIGLLAAMAVPAFQKVRTTSQEKAITNNLRQLASAADQYFLENGVSTVETQKLIGADAYIRSLDPVSGEVYPETITMGQPIIATLPNGESVQVEF